ncbi:MAG TPA: protein kinase [Polyangiaceae bacterium]|nr:protein kinase [Polyangiaceae bacterium]
MQSNEDPVTARAQARVGAVLRDKWHLDALLGVGGMAAVYAATHRNGARGAIKILHAELSVDAGIRARFLREGYAANTVGHRGVVRVLDDDVLDDGSVFVVMELLEGESLESRRERAGGRLPPLDVLSAADQLLDVLVAAHGKGVVHRDLKPENVFVTTGGELKVLDFGIAKLRQSTAGASGTRTGAAMGTPAYMPPEQARGRWEEVDARSDLWAVGATMYTLLTGRLVHEAATINEQLLAAMTVHAPSVAQSGGFAPPIVALVDRALAFDPAQRWQDASSMQEAVRAAYHAMSDSPIASAPRLSTPPSAVASARSVLRSGASPTTGAGMAGGRTGAPASTATSGRRLVWAAAGGLAAFVAALAVVILVLSRSGPSGSDSSTAVATPDSAAQPVALPSATLPSVAPAAAPAQPETSSASPVDSSPPTPSVKATVPVAPPRSQPVKTSPPPGSKAAPLPDDMLDKRR